MVGLTQIAEVIFERCQSVDPESKLVLETLMARCNTLVELLTELVNLEAPVLNDLLEPVIDEIFVDLNLTITLAMGQQFKASLVLARTCFESSLYIIFFVDHPVEAKMWANSKKDMSFSSTLDELTKLSYIKAACGTEAIDSERLKGINKNLMKVYREFSERVHGKYSFLQAVYTKNRNIEENILESFSELMNEAIQSIADLAMVRLTRKDFIEERVPSTVWRK
jgi:hypothetical protein